MAKQSASSPASSPAERDLAAFREFAVAASLLVEAESKQLPFAEFSRFVAVATPIVLGDTRRLLTTLAQKMTVLRDWMTEHDLIQVAGVTGAENAYTELLTWLIRAATHPPTALKRQRAFVELVAVKVPEFDEPLDDHSILTQVGTNDGIPDLIVLIGGECIVVEAKTGTDEHGARGSDRWQTFAYPVAVRKKFDRLKALPQIAFLTLDRQAAKNPNAKPVSWAQCAIAIAEAVRPVEVGPVLQGLFGTVITHFMTCGLDSATIELLIEITSGKSPTWNDAQVVAKLVPIQELLQVTGVGSWKK